MLANSDMTAQAGSLNNELHLPATSRHELIDFICDELPRWRDRPDRPTETAETPLTSQLCAHLNSVARHSVGLDTFQFRVEERDEQQKIRNIDLVAAPCGVVILIEGRRYTDFEPILPIECKRLPIPNANNQDRDEREYVISRFSSTGGIQRFKAGHHASVHNLAAMIAYVQEHTTGFWANCIRDWIQGLIDSTEPGWSIADYLHLQDENQEQRVAVFRSQHTRNGNLREIELRHLWIQMH